MIVFHHLFSVFGRLYLWFWGVMSLFLAGVVTLFVVFRGRAFLDADVTMWQGAQQAPRWFLFVMGIMIATTALPVAIAHGVTRSTFYAGGLLFAAVSAGLFTLATMGGLAVEGALFVVNGGIERAPEDYPMASVGNALSATSETFIALLAFLISGWATGLAFYRLRWWKALPLTPLALMPMAWTQLPPGSPLALRLGGPVVALAVAVPLLYLLMRTVPIRPKKA